MIFCYDNFSILPLKTSKFNFELLPGPRHKQRPTVHVSGNLPRRLTSINSQNGSAKSSPTEGK